MRQVANISRQVENITGKSWKTSGRQVQQHQETNGIPGEPVRDNYKTNATLPKKRNCVFITSGKQVGAKWKRIGRHVGEKSRQIETNEKDLENKWHTAGLETNRTQIGQKVANRCIWRRGALQIPRGF